MEENKRGKNFILFILFLLLAADIWLWNGALERELPEFYIFDVGQGDSEGIYLPGGVFMLTDSGPDSKIVDALNEELPDLRRIDLAFISHPQTDHFNGYRFLLNRYSFGAFILNGRSDPGVKEWDELISEIRKRNIPVITVGAGDSIRYGGNEVKILWPNADFRESGELNDTGLVEYVSTTDWRALLTADTGQNVEAIFASSSLPADILKIGHHGSKYSTGSGLLDSVWPRLAVIGVGANNSYGHPAPQTKKLLQRYEIPFLETDTAGSVKIYKSGGTLKAERQK